MCEHNRTAEEIAAKIQEACDTGIALVGPRKALDHAITVQHRMCFKLFDYVKASWEYAQATNGPKVLPLAPEVIDAYNNASGACLMVAELMNRGCLYEKDNQDFAVVEGTHTLQ